MTAQAASLSIEARSVLHYLPTSAGADLDLRVRLLKARDIAAAMHVASLRQVMHNGLASFDHGGEMEPSDLYHQAQRLIEETGAKLLVLDNLAHLFLGNENDRMQATRFLSLLNKLASDTDAAILLLAHTPSRKLTIALVKSGLIEGLTQLVENVASFTAKFAESNPTLFKFTAIAGGVAAALGPVIFGLGGLVKVAGGTVAMFLRLKSAFDIAGLLKNLIPMIATLGRVMLALVASNPLLAALTVAIGLAFAAWQNWDTIVPIVRNLYVGVKTWLQDKLGAIFDWVGKKIEQVTGFFFNMYDAVVGNSYVPDMVDGIGAEFQRLQGLMVDPAERATASVTEATRQMASDVAGLLDRLFPEFARARQMAEELALLDKGVADEGLRARARQRLLAERYGGRAGTTFDDNPEGPLVDFGKQLEAMNEAFENGAKKTELQTVRIAETVRDMAERISGSLRGLVEGITGGGFFDIFDAVLNVVTTLGGAGVFGEKFKASLGAVPGFANGGAMQLGGLAGVDRNVLSLNGSPIARVSAGETMQIRPANDRGFGGALRVTVTMDQSTGALGAFVTDTAGRVVAQAAPSIARTGAGMALDRIARTQANALA